MEDGERETENNRLVHFPWLEIARAGVAQNWNQELGPGLLVQVYTGGRYTAAGIITCSSQSAN